MPGASPYRASFLVSLVVSRLGYGIATLAGLSAWQLNCPQSVLTGAARSIAGLRRSDHFTDTLVSLHYLSVPERKKFELATMVYRSIHGTAPGLLADNLHRTSDMPSRSRLRSFNQLYQSQLSVTEHSLLAD